MIKKLLKIANCKSGAEIMEKYPTEKSFMEAFPQAASMMKQYMHGGEQTPPTADEFFDYGYPTANIPRLFQGGGQGDNAGPVRSTSIPMEAAAKNLPAITKHPKSFGQAFKEARDAGKKVFPWNGKSFTTQLKEEVAITPSKKAIETVKARVSAPEIKNLGPNNTPVVDFETNTSISRSRGYQGTPKALPNSSTKWDQSMIPKSEAPNRLNPGRWDYLDRYPGDIPTPFYDPFGYDMNSEEAFNQAVRDMPTTPERDERAIAINQQKNQEYRNKFIQRTNHPGLGFVTPDMYATPDISKYAYDGYRTGGDVPCYECGGNLPKAQYGLPEWAVPAAVGTAPYWGPVAGQLVKNQLPKIIPTYNELNKIKNTGVSNWKNLNDIQRAQYLNLKNDPNLIKLSSEELGKIAKLSPKGATQASKVMSKGLAKTPSEFANLSKVEKIKALNPELMKFLSKIKGGKRALISAALAAGTYGAQQLYEYVNPPEADLEPTGEPIQWNQPERKEGGSAGMNDNDVPANRMNILKNYIRSEVQRAEQEEFENNYMQYGNEFKGGTSLTGNWYGDTNPQMQNPHTYDPTLMSEVYDQDLIPDEYPSNNRKKMSYNGFNTEALVGAGIGLENYLSEYLERQDEPEQKNKEDQKRDPARFVNPFMMKQGLNSVNSNYYDPSNMVANSMSPGSQYVQYGSEIYDLTEDQIQEILRNGGQIQYV